MTEALSILAAGLFVTAAITDLASRRIPNALCVALAALALGRLVLTAPGLAAAAADLGVALAALITGAALFARGWLGGGDVKLIAAGVLWVGHEGAGAFLMLTAVAGGLLAMIWLLRRALSADLDPRAGALPYGVAIAIAGVAVTAAIP